MINAEKPKIGNGSRVFAAVMACVWIAAGIYAMVSGVSTGPWYLSGAGALAVVYGVLWANVVRTGRHGRIPLWF
jgi:hypothetical protein